MHWPRTPIYLLFERWQPTEISIITFDAEYNSSTEVLTLCSIPYSLRRGCENGHCKECLEQEAWCSKGRIERNIVVIAELNTAPCKGKEDTAGWILLPTAEDALLADGRYAGCLNVTFSGVYPLPWSTCFGTTQVAQWINPLPVRYVPQDLRTLVLVSAVASWSLPSWASGTDELSVTLREVQKRATDRAQVVSDWITDQLAARQAWDGSVQNGFTGSINYVSRGAHPFSIIALSFSLVSLLVASFGLLCQTTLWKVIIKSSCALVRRNPLLYAVGNRRTNITGTGTEANPGVVLALKGSHTRIEYYGQLVNHSRNSTVGTPITLILHSSGKAKLDYGPQKITQFLYGKHYRELLLTDIIRGPSSKCQCHLHDDIEIFIESIWPTAPTLEVTNNHTAPSGAARQTQHSEVNRTLKRN